MLMFLFQWTSLNFSPSMKMLKQNKYIFKIQFHMHGCSYLYYVEDVIALENVIQYDDDDDVVL